MTEKVKEIKEQEEVKEQEEKEYFDSDTKLIRNNVEVKLKNPGTEGLGDFLILARDLSKGGDNSTNFLENLTNEGINSLTKLVNLSLKKSFPDEWKNDRDDLDQWAMTHSMVLMTKIMEMCSPPMTHEQKKKQRLKLQHARYKKENIKQE